MSLVSFIICMMVLCWPWIIGKADLILMIMRVAYQNLIDVHDEHKGKHSNYHSQRQIAIGMQITGRCDMLIFLIEIQIKVKNSLGDDIKQSY